MEEIHYRQVQPDRQISGDAFATGAINFSWNHSSRNYFNPAKSYIKMRVSLITAADAAFTNETVAPSMFTFNNLFQSQQMMLDGKELCSTMDYIPQINALKSRMYKSKEYLDTVEKYSDFSDASLAIRQDVFANSRGTKEDSAPKEFDIIAKPCLSLFDVDGFLPSGNAFYNLRLTPQPDKVYQQLAVEGFVYDTTKKKYSEPTYKFKVLSMNLYLCEGIGAPCINKSLNFKVKEISCQTRLIQTGSLTSLTFQVSPKSEEITCALQMVGAGVKTVRYPASKFRCFEEQELELRRLYLTYGGKSLPNPQEDIELTDDSDFILQRYYETLNYGGSLNIKASKESLKDWIERGVYFHFSGYSRGAKSDRLQINTQFANANFKAPLNVLIFDHRYKNISISIRGGNVSNISSN